MSDVERVINMAEAVVAASADCVVVIDAAGRVVEFNPAAEATFGYPRDDALGRELAELIVPPHLRERHRRALARCVETGEGTILGRPVEFVGMRAGGSEFPVEITVAALPGAELFVGFVRDITARQREQEGRRWLAAVVDQAEDGVLTKDQQGLITSWNPGAQRLYGYRAEEVLGRSIRLLIPPHKAGEERRILDQIVRGERLDHYETERVRKDGRVIDVSITISPLHSAEGDVIGASVIAREITALKRHEHGQRLLAQAGAVLDRSLDPRSTLRAIAELTVPDLCELCVIDLVDEDGRPSWAVAAAADDPELASSLQTLRERYPLDPKGDHPVARALRTGEPELLPELTDEVLQAIAQSEEHLEFMRRFRYRSAVVVPLRARGRTLGVLSVLHLHDDRTYDREDLDLLLQLASRAAVAYDNARLYAERSRIAATLQEGLLPPALPAIPGFDLAAQFRPAGEGLDVGGDFYDIFETGEGAWTLVIGDVCGKGAQAAALTALARHTVRALAGEGHSPSEILVRLNRSMIGAAEMPDRYLTIVVGALEVSRERRTLRLASAGHPSPLRVGPEGCVEMLSDGGPLAGVYSDTGYHEQEFSLDAGDAVVFYTDGVTDAGAPQRIVSIEDLRSAVAAHDGESADRIAAAIDRLAVDAGQRRPRDDIAVLVLRAGAAGDSH
jgi:PAS domain S-box-containing protein